MSSLALTLNVGSSTLKFCLYECAHKWPWEIEFRGQIDRIATAPHLRIVNSHDECIVDEVQNVSGRDVRSALGCLIQWLRSNHIGDRIVCVGHRIVHGGARFDKPVLVTPDVLAELAALTPLAPLHQPDCIAPIEAIHAHLPGVPQVACFDTSFHRGRSRVATVVPLPSALRDRGIERYGFHGISYEFIASTLPIAAPQIARKKVIIAHLGSGASLCAINDGKCVDTTMGFTALDGLCMGTRPGALDPGIVLYLIQTLGLSAERIAEVLYRESGLLGISGTSNDMRELLNRTDPQSRLAVDYFVYRAIKEIAALAAVLRGADALVFTAGIGEHSAEIRARIGNSLAWLGIEIDGEANAAKRVQISTSQSKVSVWVIPTNEELVIAKYVALQLGFPVDVAPSPSIERPS